MGIGCDLKKCKIIDRSVRYVNNLILITLCSIIMKNTFIIFNNWPDLISNRWGWGINMVIDWEYTYKVLKRFKWEEAKLCRWGILILLPSSELSNMSEIYDCKEWPLLLFRRADPRSHPISLMHSHRKVRFQIYFASRWRIHLRDSFHLTSVYDGSCSN
jgi:hypothetical protein